MIINNNELNERLKKYCLENNVDRELFEIAIIGKGKGSTDRLVLKGPTNVKNENCTYVIKLFLIYDLIIIWNYKNNHSMSYSYKTIQEKLKKGICSADKGKFTHSSNQSKVFFEYTENFEKILNCISEKI